MTIKSKKVTMVSAKIKKNKTVSVMRGDFLYRLLD